MILAALLLIAVSLAGAAATFLYRAETPVGVRLSAGILVGLTAWGLLAFALASLFGLTLTVVLASAAILGVAAGLSLGRPGRRRVSDALRQLRRTSGEALRHPRRLLPALAYYLAIGVVLWICFGRAMIVRDQVITTGYVDNYADLTLHLAIIDGFTLGENFPPEHPEYSGTRLTYPFLADFLAALLVRAGAETAWAMFLENMVLCMALVVLLRHWAELLTGSRLAAWLTPPLVLLNGGLGWTLFLEEALASSEGTLHFLLNLPHDYTAHTDLYRWANSIVYWFVPMRSMLLGLPLFVIISTLWWRGLSGEPAAGGAEKGSTTSGNDAFLASGAIAGLLPLAHAHTYAVVLAMGGCLALISRRFRAWLPFFALALALGLPQVYWVTRESSVHAQSFIGKHIGWTSGSVNAVWYWFLNTGAFIPVLLLALVLPGRTLGVSRRLALFFLPFLLCFAIPNVVKLAPWEWDNIKVLAYWYVAAVPLVALFLARLWERGRSWRLTGALLFASLTLAGALDVFRVMTGALEWQDFSAGDVEFARLVARATPPRSIILNAGIINHPVLLSGRRSFMGYTGRIMSHGLAYADRETDVKNIYAGKPQADELLRRHRIGYVVVGPPERETLSANEEFFMRFPLVGEAGGYRLYAVPGS